MLAKPAREQQLTLIWIFEDLRSRGYDGGYDALVSPVTVANVLIFSIEAPFWVLLAEFRGSRGF